mgnify:CR=1 FL=1
MVSTVSEPQIVLAAARGRAFRAMSAAVLSIAAHRHPIESARLFERSRELSTLEERNRLARELHDSGTQTMHAAAVTEVLERVHGVRIVVDAECDRRLDARTEQALFRIAQAALGNAVRRAGASCVSVRLALANGGLVLRVRDDGRGFDPAAVDRRGRVGLVSMRERAERLGGTLRIESAPGAGTTVSLGVAV